MSACAEGWVTIVTNIKELAETSLRSCIWAYVTVWCNPVQVSDWWQTGGRGCGCHSSSSSVYTLKCVVLCRSKNLHFPECWKWGVCFFFFPPPRRRADEWRHRTHWSVCCVPGIASAHLKVKYKPRGWGRFLPRVIAIAVAAGLLWIGAGVCSAEHDK